MSRRFSLRAHGFCTTCLLLGALIAGCSGSHSDESLCTKARDPSGSICAHPERRLTSLTAEKLARESVGDAALVSIAGWPVDPDGAAKSWDLAFIDRKSAEVIRLEVTTRGADMISRTDPYWDCRAEYAITVLDSRALVHDALARLEHRTGTFIFGPNALIDFTQYSCFEEWLPEEHDVEFSTSSSGDGQNRTVHFARYRADGLFIELAGPCKTADLAKCLDGDMTMAP